MASLLKLKKSSVSGKVPLTTDLAYGELALNYADGLLYYKNTNNAIVNLGTQGIQGVQGTSIQGIQGLSGGGVQNWSRKTSNYVASNSDRIIADTSGGGFTVSLPGNPQLGATVTITDGSSFSTNNLVVSRNDSTIENTTNDVLLDISGTTYEFIYDGTTWHITASVGTPGVQGTQGIQGGGYNQLQGIQGISGYIGSDGAQGIQGISGYIGSDGAQGIQGAIGQQGIQGTIGQQGVQGISQQGVQGVQGVQGAQGIQGAIGQQGIQGTIGQQGVQGISQQGIQGIQGASGNNLEYVTYTYTSNGSTTSYQASNGINVNTVLVVLDGIVQTPTTDYTINGSSVVFDVAPPNGSIIQIRVLGDVSTTSIVPKITSIAITDSNYQNIDDTAVNLSGGYIVITGTGFNNGCQIVVGTLVATSVSFINSTTVRAQVPQQVAGTYTVYLTNSDGSVAIRVNGLNYSSTPTWQTTSPLSSGVKNTPISIQLAATSNSTVTYTLQSGSTLPSGLSLSSSGLLSGTVSNIATDTTYNFTIVATDSELQDTPQALQITIVIGDPYYKLTTLHLPGVGTNNAQNNTFLDSSTNNFTITRSGNTTQGTFSPFSQTGWGNYFNGSSYLRFAHANLSSNFTVEFWVYRTVGSTLQTFVHFNSGGVSGAIIYVDASNYLTVTDGTTGQSPFTGQTVPINTWTHIAVVRNSGTTTGYINGSSVGSNSFTPASVNAVNIAYYASGSPLYLTGYVSNARVVNNQALYTGNFTPATAPLTTSSVGTSGANVAGSITGTVSLLTCQSNRFIDNANNAAPTTISGSPSVQAFSPFNPTSSWSAVTNGGSGYFDGTGDYLTLGGQTALAMGAGDFTIEFWAYLTSTAANPTLFDTRGSGTTGGTNITLYFSPGGILNYYANSAIQISSSAFPTNTWTHVAVSRASGSTRMFFNGVQQGSTYSDSTTYTVGTSRPIIGADGYSTGINAMTGYLSDVRILKGTGYSTITVPTAPLTNITNTSLLLNFTNAGIYDATSKNDLETVGDAKISTAQSKFGGSSMAFDGTGDYAICNSSSSNTAFGSGNWTIEFWLYLNTTSGTQLLCDFRKSTSSDLAPMIMYYTNAVCFYTNANIQITGSSISANTWTHIAVCKSSGSTKLFINGTQSGSTYTDSLTYIGFADRPVLGAEGVSVGANPMNGYLQDVRVSKYARYTTNFTPPTAAFPPQ